MNNLSLSVALATAPASAFEELRQRPRFWFPLLLLVLSTAAVFYWYYSMVDVEWLKYAVLSDDPSMKKLPESERAAAMAMLTRTTLLWSSVVSIILVIPIVFLLWAVYFLLAAKVTRLPQGFKHWFTFVCWTALPMLLSTVVAAILMLLSDTAQVSPSALQPLSFNELVLHRPVGSPGHLIFESLGIPMVLTMILMIIGVRAWSQRSWMFSTIFVFLPNVLLYGAWSFLAFR